MPVEMRMRGTLQCPLFLCREHREQFCPIVVLLNVKWKIPDLYDVKRVENQDIQVQLQQSEWKEPWKIYYLSDIFVLSNAYLRDLLLH